MKKLIITSLLSTFAAMAIAAPSILDIKHSITDDNIVAPESFETKTRELEENFYLQTYTTPNENRESTNRLGTPKEYEERLSRLPTEIELPYNSVVGKYIDMYLGRRSGMVADMLALHNYYGNIFVEELLKEKMPTELQYLPIIESALNPNAVSRAGAGGLWQFMPATAKGLGMEVNSLVDQRRDPRLASRYAAKYLKQLYGIYGDWSLAIAAYNCGPGNVNKALRRAGGGKKDYWEIYNYLPSETRGYVPAFIAANYVMNYYNKHGIKPRVVKQHLVTDTVLVNNRVHFNQIANVLNIPVEEIRMLNPQFRKDIIPGNNHAYALVLPSQQCLSYVISEPQILDYDRELYAQRTYVEPGATGSDDTATDDCATQPEIQQSLNATENVEIAQNIATTPNRIIHTVSRGENLRDIAKKYNVSATDIKHWNNLRRGKVKEGDQLTIETYDQALMASATTSRTVPAPASNGRTATQASVPMPPKKAEPAPAASVPERRVYSSTTKPDGASAQVPQRRNNSSTQPSPSSEPESTTAAPSRKRERQARESASGTPTPSKAKQGGNKTQNSKSGPKKNRANAKPKPVTHNVKQGESLEKIAKQHGTTVEAIRSANGMKKNETTIRTGQKLNIPSSGKASASSSKGKKQSAAKTSSNSRNKKSSGTRKKRR